MLSLNQTKFTRLYYHMPFTRKTIHLDRIEIHLIYFQDFLPEAYLDVLNEHDLRKLATYNHINRKREFIATRILKHELFGHKHIHYELHGAPYIDDEGYISISHSSNCSAIAVCRDFAIGLDLEKRSPKAALLQNKFLNNFELSFLDSKNELTMTEAWSCKESLYKLAGRKKIHFKSELLLHSKSSDVWRGEIINPSEKFFVKLLSIPEKDMVITINTQEIERIDSK